MKVTIIGDNVELLKKDKDLIRDKVVQEVDENLEDFEEDMKKPSIRVHKINSTGEFKVNFNMWLPGKEHVFAEETHEVFVTALTALRDKIIKQIKKYKEKL